ncbi:MAG: FHA domain-containing protein, partial [Firmicutes bacterium]|nr:FHA domain-containing protein [Bacillota bacterium]
IEGFFKTKFAAHIQPAEIAKLLIREMRDNKNVSVSKVYVPNEYTVFLGSEDWQIIDSVHKSLSEELQEFLIQKAADKGYEIIGEVKVAFERGEDLPLGTVFVKAVFSGEPPQTEELKETEDSKETEEAKPIECTMVVERGRFYNKVKEGQPQDTLTRLTAAGHSPKALLMQRVSAGNSVKFPLGTRGVIIGRRRTNDIRLEDTNVSRVHASIDYTEGNYFITDLGSTNGTFVNGIRISKKRLVEGDQVRVGTTILEFKVV